MTPPVVPVDAGQPAVLVHGGSMARRSALAHALRGAAALGVRVRVSSRAAEAAKCLADPLVIAVLLVDAPDDADVVRAAVVAMSSSRVLSSPQEQRAATPRRARVYDLEPRDDADVVISLVREALREALSARTGA
jgi:hypothetical protein